jgi:DNA repair protein RecN (Recombination protein N)
VIRTLRVRNLAVIEELELELGPGLNVITGETGAGKSVLLGAVALLRGRRISSELVRTGADEASIEVVLDAPDILDRLSEQGQASDGDEELLVTRTVSREGRGRVRMNGAVTTAQLLGRTIGDGIEVVGQGEHQRLLQAEVQATLLDGFSGLDTEIDTVQALHRRWVELARDIAERRRNSEARLRQEDRLRFEIEQIRAVDPKPGELEELETERVRLANLDGLARGTAAGLETLQGEGGLCDRTAELQSRLAQSAKLDPVLERVTEALGRADVELQEAVAELQRYAASLDPDPGRLELLESRLSDYHRLLARYGSTIEEILDHARSAEVELESIGGGEARIQALEQERADVGERLAVGARELSERRKKGAEVLSRAVEAELQALDLRGARFEIRLVPTEARAEDGDAPPSGPRGRERGEFWLAANAGDEPRRLRDAASGGELARIVLALRTALRDTDHGRILLFDEVDAGIGGRTARRVGERLRRLGSRHQVLCITHLPQIAALGETHYRIVKRVRGGRTAPRVERLSGEARVDEIARMSGGGRITATARAHARELLGTSPSEA